MNTRTADKDDFDAPAIAKQVSDHARDMANITKRLEDLEAKFSTSEKIGDTICGTIERDTKIQERIETVFSKLITTNDSVKNSITSLIEKTDRDWLATQGRRISSLTGKIIMLVIGAVITLAVQRYSPTTQTNSNAAPVHAPAESR